MQCLPKCLYSIVVTFFVTNDVLRHRPGPVAYIRGPDTDIADTGNGPYRQCAVNHPVTIGGGVIFRKIYLPVFLANDGIIVPLHPTLYSLLQREDTKVGGSRQGGGATSRCAGSRTAEAAAGRTGDVTSHAGGSSRGGGEERAP